MKIEFLKNRALKLSAPFLFVALALILISIGSIMLFTKSNLYYRVMTNAPSAGILSTEVNASGGKITATMQEFSEEETAQLQLNNIGMDISSDFPQIAINQKWATITIPSAGVDSIPVYNSTDDDIMMMGIGHHLNSRFPGQGGRIVLPGHVGISRFFQRLENMNIGDSVYLNTIYGDYEYRVKSTAIVDEDDTSLVLPVDDESEDELICYTCYPYRTTEVRTQRFLIICEKVSGKNWREETDY